MDDCKEFLKISLKPEPLIFYYFCGVCLLAFALIVYGICQGAYWVLLVSVAVYFAYKGCLEHYQLSSDQSVAELRLSTQNELTIRLKDSSEINVILVDKLLINNHLMLRFESSKNGLETKFKMTGENFLKHKCLSFFRSLKVFCLQEYYQVYLSETTLGKLRFRQLLRRLNAM